MPEYRNPNQAGGGSSDSRSFLVLMFVMLIVIFGLQMWRAKHDAPTASPQAQGTVTAPAGKTAAAPAAAVPAANTQAPATPAIQAAAQSTTVVDNELYRITFSNRGGQVISWILKRYKDDQGHPLDLVHDGAAKLYGYPLSLYTYDPTLTAQLANALYVPSATGMLEAPASLTFKYAAGDLSVTKTFTFSNDYVIGAKTEVLRNGAPIGALLAWPAGFGDMENSASYASATIDSNDNGHVDHTSYKKVSGGATLNGPFDYAGVSDQYFAAVFLPAQPNDATMVTLDHEIDISRVHSHAGEKDGKKEIKLPVLGAAVGSTNGTVSTRIFVGPKDWSVLGSIHTAGGGSLHSVLDFGFWGWLGEGLFLGLRAVHGWIAPAHPGAHDYSWGWAILLFTTIIYTVLMPLRYQGMKGMLKMQRIQPQIDEIKAKHGNPGPTDAKAGKMNAEIMELQKKHGVSMFGGCVPSLIQLPLLIAFFTMMTRVVELRQAHWFWLPDLSQADPWHILPIFVILSMFLMQYYTPTPGVDPAQAKLMAFTMPAISGIWTWNYASGLALYWAMSSIIQVLQQFAMNRTAPGKEMRQLQLDRAARKTLAKNQAKGRTAGTGGRVIQGRR